MPQINLVWNDATGQVQNYEFTVLGSTPDATLKIGRDQQKCGLWLQHNTVSREHAAVTYKAQWERFYVQNLARKNPIRVDGGLLVEGEVALYEGSVLQLGQRLVQVSGIVLGAIAPSVPASASASVAPVQVSPLQSASVSQPQPVSVTAPNNSQAVEAAHNHSVAPKLLCPKCQNLQLLSLRNSNCPVCGHFLADASSRYFFKEESN